MLASHTISRLTILLFACIVSGCGGSGGKLTAKASGKVQFQGAPVTEGMVNFFDPKTGQGAGVPLDSAGSFHVPDGLPIGTYKVSVLPPADETAAGAPQVTKPKEYPQIPQKYRSDTTSSLTAEVKRNVDNQFTFDLQP